MASSLTFAVPVEWDITRTYEINNIVFIGKKAYTALQDVPAGITIDNVTYWSETGIPAEMVNYLARIIKEGFFNETTLVNPTGVTLGDMRVDWNEGRREFRIFGWFDIPVTQVYDPDFHIDYALPSNFPTINGNKYVHMGTPCVVSGTNGLIYGGLSILSTNVLRFHIPHVNIQSVYLPPLTLPIP